MNDTDTTPPRHLGGGAEIPYSSNDKNDAPNPVISTEAERSGEISCPMVQGAWRQEISRLRVSRARIFPPCRQVPPLGMTNGPVSYHQKIVMEKRL